jgi:hypothetical protein
MGTVTHDSLFTFERTSLERLKLAAGGCHRRAAQACARHH